MYMECMMNKIIKVLHLTLLLCWHIDAAMPEIPADASIQARRVIRTEQFNIQDSLHGLSDPVLQNIVLNMPSVSDIFQFAGVSRIVLNAVKLKSDCVLRFIISTIPSIMPKKLAANKPFEALGIISENTDLGQQIVTVMNNKTVTECYEVAKDRDSAHPIIIASKKGYSGLVRSLCDYIIPNRRKVIIYEAAEIGCVEVIRLLSSGDYWNFYGTDSFFYRDWFEIAAENGHLDILDFLYYSKNFDGCEITNGCVKKSA